MARRRMIDPGIWSDPTIGELSIAARLLFIGMVSLADDEGRIDLNVRYLRKEVFGYDDLTVADVCVLLSEIRAKCKNIQTYEVDEREYAVFITWSRYQKIDRAYRSRLPDPPGYVAEKQLAEWSTNKHRAKANDPEPFDDNSTNVRRTFPPKEKEKEKEKVKLIQENGGDRARAQVETQEREEQTAAADLLVLGFNKPQMRAAIKAIPDLTVDDVAAWALWLPTSDKDNPIGFMAWALGRGQRLPDPPLKRAKNYTNGHVNGRSPPQPDLHEARDEDGELYLALPDGTRWEPDE